MAELCLCRGSLGRLPFCYFALQSAGFRGKLPIARLQQESIKSASMFNRAQRVGANSQAHLAVQRFTHKAYIAKIGQKSATRLVMRVAHIVAGLNVFSCQLTTPGHGLKLLQSNPRRGFANIWIDQRNSTAAQKMRGGQDAFSINWHCFSQDVTVEIVKLRSDVDELVQSDILCANI